MTQTPQTIFRFSDPWKFGLDWPIGVLGDVRRVLTTDGPRRTPTDDGACLYYKLPCEPNGKGSGGKGSGELKMLLSPNITRNSVKCKSLRCQFVRKRLLLSQQFNGDVSLQPHARNNKATVTIIYRRYNQGFA